MDNLNICKIVTNFAQSDFLKMWEMSKNVDEKMKKTKIDNFLSKPENQILQTEARDSDSQTLHTFTAIDFREP